MASAFGHAVASIAIGNSFSKNIQSFKFWILGIACSILPDADVIAFKLGIPYEHVFGHRGITHSFFFAFLIGISIVALFYRKEQNAGKVLLMLAFSLSTISHSILDAFTNGGLGVAFFAPFDNSRYFFPWRPIQVSPIGAGNFFSKWGLRVIKSEMIWIGIPSLLYIVICKYVNRNFTNQKGNTSKP